MQHRIILIGHGSISKSYQKAISFIENAAIVGVVGRNSEKVKDYCQSHGISIGGTHMEEVARRANATAVIICTPNAAHYEAVMDASQLGLHCLCEKPLHISTDKQLAMIECCKTNNVRLAVSYMRRFSNHMEFIKKTIDSGALGRITAIDVMIKHFRNKEYYHSWHGTKEEDGGGPFIQQASHIIDLALWMCGGFREVLGAKIFQIYHEIETEDHGYAIVQYNNGAIGMIQASTACKGFNKEVIEISGTEGSIVTNYNEILSFQVPGLQKPLFENIEADNIVLFERLVRDFIQSIEESRLPFVHGESAALTTELINAIYKKAGVPIRTNLNI